MKTTLVTLLAAVLCVEQDTAVWFPIQTVFLLFFLFITTLQRSVLPPSGFEAYSFMCYVCQEQESNKDCLTISMCPKEDKYCVTIRNNIGTQPNKPKYVISKMCSPTCPATSQQQTPHYQKVSCCEKPLCNVNGVSSKQSSYGIMSLGVLASITYMWTVMG